MTDAETILRLKSMRLTGMADCLTQLELPGQPALTAPEVVKLMTDWEWDRRNNSKLARLRKAAGLAQPNADIGDIQHLADRKADYEMISRLAIGNYLIAHQDFILQGPTGAGKTFVACALGNRACQQYKTVKYTRAAELCDELTIADKAGTRSQLMNRLVKVELLIIDDWLLTAPSATQVQWLHTLIDRHTSGSSTIYATQLPPAKWYDRMDEKIVAEAIIDRVTNNPHTITLKAAESMRRQRRVH
jgi:DNA replication protein DnaC